jgi:hypothetical protein
MGCRTAPYWIGNFCFDYIIYVIVSAFFFIFAAIFKITPVTTYVGEWIVLLLA